MDYEPIITIWMTILGHNFALVTTYELSWPVEIWDLIELLES